MLRTPKGIAVADVAKIGSPGFKLDLVSPARGGYFARRGRDIYLSGSGSNSGGGRGEVASAPSTSTPASFAKSRTRAA